MIFIGVRDVEQPIWCAHLWPEMALKRLSVWKPNLKWLGGKMKEKQG